MFKKQDNKTIGNYLSTLIEKRQYSSDRQFCKAWLIADNMEPDTVNLQRRANKLSQIKNGSNAIQLEDLPTLAGLLDATCEEILSAGQVFVPDHSRLTNYLVAFSQDEAVWEAYIHRDDDLILNTDEYNKTVIDYALQFKNYKLLKYLTEKGYIWFVADDEKNYFQTFRAGTSIQRKLYPATTMETLLWENDQLRRKMIVLAIENKDYDMLTTLKAREIPTFYQAAHFSGRPTDCRSYYDEDMLASISRADGQTLAYFTEEYEIKDGRGRINQFTFPFVGELLDLLIQAKSEHAGRLIDRCIEHNKNAIARLKQQIKEEEQRILQELPLARDMYSETFLEQQKQNRRALAVQLFDFYEVENMVSFFNNRYTGLVTNVIHIRAKSDDPQVSQKITEVNDLYEAIKNLKEAVLNGQAFL